MEQDVVITDYLVGRLNLRSGRVVVFPIAVDSAENIITDLTRDAPYTGSVSGLDDRGMLRWRLLDAYRRRLKPNSAFGVVDFDGSAVVVRAEDIEAIVISEPGDEPEPKSMGFQAIS